MKKLNAFDIFLEDCAAFLTDPLPYWSSVILFLIDPQWAQFYTFLQQAVLSTKLFQSRLLISNSTKHSDPSPIVKRLLLTDWTSCHWIRMETFSTLWGCWARTAEMNVSWWMNSTTAFWLSSMFPPHQENSSIPFNTALKELLIQQQRWQKFAVRTGAEHEQKMCW